MTARAAPKPAKAPRGRARRGRSGAAVALVVGVALALLAVATAAYALTPRGGRGVVVRVVVPRGVTTNELTGILWRAHVIERPWAFQPLALLAGVASRVRPGMIALRDDLTPWAVLRALARSRGLARVTVPEGFTRFELARRLESAGVCDAERFLQRTEAPELLTRAGVAVTPGASLEGYLFPDTYDLPLAADTDEVIDRMTRVFYRRLEALKGRHPDGVARALSVAGADPDALDRVLVTMASLIEKETGTPDDRPRVASVFWNRLTRPDFHPRLLQSDPTVVYGCLAGPRAGLFAGPCGEADAGARMPITAAMLDDARNPWNTYRHEALPPTPVCNPGAAALEAALAPAATDDLYFVARPDGRSAFARTLDEHRRNVRELLGTARRRP